MPDDLPVVTPHAKKELLTILRYWAKQTDDPTVAHQEADRALLDYIGDEEVSVAFDSIQKWYE